MGQYADRRVLLSWLVNRGLIDQSEAERAFNTFHLPTDFEERVLERFGAAEPAERVDGVTSQTIIPAAVAERIPPPHRTFEAPCPPLLGGGMARYVPAELHEARVGKVFVGLKQTTLMLDDRTYFAGISRQASSWITPAFAPAPGELKLKGTVAILFANGATHFSHWMFDLLPKIEVLRRSGWNTANIDHYIVNGFRSSFQKESFRKLGIPEEKVVCVAGSVVSAERMLIPSDIRLNFRTPAWARDFIRDLFAPTAGHGNGRLRLYISRASARRRRLLNEEQLEHLLNERGYQTVFAENMSIAEMAAIACRAAAIVAPHGAGATNVVFGPPGIRLLEMYSAHIAPEAWILTHSVGGRHFLLAGHDEEGRFPWQEGAYAGLSKLERNYADYSVRPPDLACALDMIAQS